MKSTYIEKYIYYSTRVCNFLQICQIIHKTVKMIGGYFWCKWPCLSRSGVLCDMSSSGDRQSVCPDVSGR